LLHKGVGGLSILPIHLKEIVLKHGSRSLLTMDTGMQVEGAVPEGKANASGQPVILNMKARTGNAAATVARSNVQINCLLILNLLIGQ
jgi:hypothetical protein